MGWRQVASETQGGKMLSTMTMETNPTASTNIDSTAISVEDLLFKREVRGIQIDEDDTDLRCLQEGYITVTPLGALSPAEIDCEVYYKRWLPSLAERLSSSAL